MSRILNCNFFRRLTNYRHLRRDRIYNLTSTFHRACLSNKIKLLAGFKLCCATIIATEQTDDIGMDEELQKALAQGNFAIIELMDYLKELVAVVSQEYRRCLTKQIEITNRALEIGPFSDAWDEIPKYRTLADELNTELNNYSALFNTIGQMADEKSLAEFITGSTENFDMVSVRFKELELFVQKEFEENRKIEVELLKLNRDIILRNIPS